MWEYIAKVINVVLSAKAPGNMEDYYIQYIIKVILNCALSKV